MSFQYLIDKIAAAEFTETPFRHIQINNFFSDDDFATVTSQPEIALTPVSSDTDLFQALFDQGYKIIQFPGCITDREKYIRWHQDRGNQKVLNNTACEGFGMTLRLLKPLSPFTTELVAFMNSDAFQSALAKKFGVEMASVRPDTGIQKYLDGYEISPHPDIRTKAVTYMVNINPGANSEHEEHHTHYMKFKKDFNYVNAYWEGHPNEDRCWVPWNWCETVKMQNENNSIVLFSPDNTTMHSVKAAYNHLGSQRTQMYGNLWYRDLQVQPGPEWEDMVINVTRHDAAPSLLKKIKGTVPSSVKDFVRSKVFSKDDGVEQGSRSGR